MAAHLRQAGVVLAVGAHPVLEGWAWCSLCTSQGCEQGVCKSDVSLDRLVNQKQGPTLTPSRCRS